MTLRVLTLPTVMLDLLREDFVATKILNRHIMLTPLTLNQNSMSILVKAKIIRQNLTANPTKIRIPLLLDIYRAMLI